MAVEAELFAYSGFLFSLVSSSILVILPIQINHEGYKMEISVEKNRGNHRYCRLHIGAQCGLVTAFGAFGGF
jgi:hypothetical protein